MNNPQPAARPVKQLVRPDDTRIPNVADGVNTPSGSEVLTYKIFEGPRPAIKRWPQQLKNRESLHFRDFDFIAFPD
ncbi:MAG: hypothetical protein ACRER2_00970 [Methylococcales bacterium]